MASMVYGTPVSMNNMDLKGPVYSGLAMTTCQVRLQFNTTYSTALYQDFSCHKPLGVFVAHWLCCQVWHMITWDFTLVCSAGNTDRLFQLLKVLSKTSCHL